jgi:hypothetical protein
MIPLRVQEAVIMTGTSMKRKKMMMSKKIITGKTMMSRKIITSSAVNRVIITKKMRKTITKEKAMAVMITVISGKVVRANGIPVAAVEKMTMVGMVVPPVVDVVLRAWILKSSAVFLPWVEGRLTKMMAVEVIPAVAMIMIVVAVLPVDAVIMIMIAGIVLPVVAAVLRVWIRKNSAVLLLWEEELHTKMMAVVAGRVTGVAKVIPVVMDVRLAVAGDLRVWIPVSNAVYLQWEEELLTKMMAMVAAGVALRPVIQVATATTAVMDLMNANIPVIARAGSKMPAGKEVLQAAAGNFYWYTRIISQPKAPLAQGFWLILNKVSNHFSSTCIDHKKVRLPSRLNFYAR